MVDVLCIECLQAFWQAASLITYRHSDNREITVRPGDRRELAKMLEYGTDYHINTHPVGLRAITFDNGKSLCFAHSLRGGIR